MIVIISYFANILQMLHHTLRKIIYPLSQLYPKNPDLSTSVPTFHANKLRKVNRRVRLDPPPFHPAKLPFGKYHTDHMITVDYERNLGWTDPVLRPFENLQLHPFSSALHYGVQCYEGTKAYKNQKGQVRLFRVEQNALRMKRSSIRLTLPDFDGQELVNLIMRLVREDEKWIPPITECSLYIRPFHLGISETLGVHSPEKSKLIIAAGPVGSYYASGFKPISLYCESDTIRSAPKGTGNYKIGGNYGPTIQASSKVELLGHHQILWLYEEKVIEVGSSNIFFVFKDKSGDIEIATPLLQDLVLPGITRDSILQLLRDQKQYKVSERNILISEVVERQQRGELLQCFGSGTAVILSGVDNIHYKGVNYTVPVDPKLNIGPISHKIRQTLLDIQEGRAEDRYGWITRVK